MLETEKQTLLAELQTRVNKDDSLPLYQQLQRALDKRLRDGSIKPNVKLPLETEFSDALNVNPRTVQKALNGLRREGLIKRIRKSGTFTCPIPSTNRTVGFFYPAENFPIMSVGEQVQIQLALYNVDLKIIGYQKDYFQQHNFEVDIRRRNIDGALIVVPPDDAAKNALLELERTGFPIVRLSNTFSDSEFYSSLVINDMEKAFSDTLDYLRCLGHSRIGILCSYFDETRQRQHLRLAGQINGWENRMLRNLDFYGAVHEWQANPNLALIDDFISGNPDLTAIIVEHPAVCVDIVRLLSENGRRIPQDVSVVSLVDSDILLGASPPISAMQRQLDVMAQRITELMLEAMTQWPPVKNLIKVELKLVERDSVAKYRSKTSDARRVPRVSPPALAESV